MTIKCQYHKNKGLHPKMINFGTDSMGTEQFVCARCARIRFVGEGRIINLKESYGFVRTSIVRTRKIDFFF